MTKGKNKKPASKAKAKVKKVEPVVEKIETVEEVILEAAEDGVVTPEEIEKLEKVKAEVKEQIEKALEGPDGLKKEIAEVLVEEVKELEALEVKDKREFPDEEAVCTHPHTRRRLDRRSRATHICTNPKCGKIVKIGGR